MKFCQKAMEMIICGPKPHFHIAVYILGNHRAVEIVSQGDWKEKLPLCKYVAGKLGQKQFLCGSQQWQTSRPTVLDPPGFSFPFSSLSLFSPKKTFGVCGFRRCLALSLGLLGILR